MAGLNFNRSDITGVHFSIPHAENYGLTTENLLEEFVQSTNICRVGKDIWLRGDTNGVISVAGAQMTYAMFRDIMHHVSNNSEYKIPGKIRRQMEQSVAEMTDQIYLALISEVYFARSMDITIERKTATGANGSARPIAAAELKQLKDMGLLAVHTRTNSVTSTTETNASTTSTNVVTGTKAEMIDVTEGDSAFDLARKLRGLESPDGVDKIGGSVRVLSVSASSIGLRRTFERPICVGVRGVLVKIDVNNPVALEPNGKKEWMKVESFGH